VTAAWPRRSLLFAAASALLPVAGVLVRLAPLDALLGLVERQRREERAAAPGLDELQRIVDAAARLTLPRSTCLTRSLVLMWLVARNGGRPILHIGVSRSADVLQAHAWVSLGAPDAGGPAVILHEQMGP